MIPAWAKVTALALSGLMVAACMPGNLACRRLSAELERVQRDGGVRQSGVWTEVSPIELGDRAEIVIARERKGDFPYYYDLFATRSCLGPGWSEARDEMTAPGWQTPATRFTRADRPDVVVYEDVALVENERRSRSRVLIEARSP